MRVPSISSGNRLWERDWGGVGVVLALVDILESSQYHLVHLERIQMCLGSSSLFLCERGGRGEGVI